MVDALKKTPLCALLILTVVLIAYVPAMKGGFIWDDDSYVTGNETLRTPDGLSRIWFEMGAIPQYYPLVHTTFWVEYQLWADDATGYHINNVCLHAVNAVLLLLLLRKLGVPCALLAALIFAVHPVHVESVAWITERKNVLSGMFYLLAMLAYFRFETAEQDDSGAKRQWGAYAAALLLFLCALFSKTVTATLPAAILLLIWWERGRIPLRSIMPLLPFFAVGIGLGLVTVWMEAHNLGGTGKGATGEEWDFSPIDRVLIAGRALWFYAGSIAWPSKLTFIYPRWQIDSAVLWQYLFPLGAVAVITILIALRRSIGRGPLTAILYSAGTLMPALGFFNVYPFRYSFVADHFQYLGSLGFIVLFVATGSWLIRRIKSCPPWFGLGLAVIILGSLASLTWRQGDVYKDLPALWADTIAKNDRCWMAHNNLGLFICRAGNPAAGIEHFDMTLKIKPDHAGAHINKSDALMALGKPAQALRHAREAVRLDPDWAILRAKLGVVLLKEGETEEAVTCLKGALQMQPTDHIAHGNIAHALNSLGRYDEAIHHAGEAVRLDPAYRSGYVSLGAALFASQKYARAESAYRKALALNDRDDRVHYALGLTLESLNKRSDAVVQYQQALLINPRDTASQERLNRLLTGS